MQNSDLFPFLKRVPLCADLNDAALAMLARVSRVRKISKDATRQTTAKILGQWRRAGWIVTGRGRIVVLDRAALRKVTGDT